MIWGRELRPYRAGIVFYFVVCSLGVVLTSGFDLGNDLARPDWLPVFGLLQVLSRVYRFLPVFGSLYESQTKMYAGGIHEYIRHLYHFSTGYHPKPSCIIWQADTRKVFPSVLLLLTRGHWLQFLQSLVLSWGQRPQLSQSLAMLGLCGLMAASLCGRFLGYSWLYRLCSSSNTSRTLTILTIETGVKIHNWVAGQHLFKYARLVHHFL